MPVQELLARLEGVRGRGDNRWLARCPGPLHKAGDKHQSLSVAETAKGAILLHCFAGCDVAEIIASIGFQLSDLFPPRDPTVHHHPGHTRNPFPAGDVLKAVAHEALIVSIAADLLLHEGELSAPDHNRLALAMRRLNEASEFAGSR